MHAIYARLSQKVNRKPGERASRAFSSCRFAASRNSRVAGNIFRAMVLLLVLAGTALSLSGCHNDQDIIDRHEQALRAEDDAEQR